MDQVTIDLKNCYGIKCLQHMFDFSDESVYALYAPNGAMKSSFAQVFRDIADGKPSQDRIYPTRKSERKVVDENGTDLAPESVLVVRPYDEELGHTEKTSTLLVDAKLRKEYEQLYNEIDKIKELFLKALKEQSGSKKDLEKEISSTFTKSDKEFYKALIRIKDEVLNQKEAPFAQVAYDIVFDDKVLAALNTKDVKTLLEDYVSKYNELLAASTYFKKGTFDYYNATNIARSLAENGFFDANHSVNLNADEKKEITTVKQLEELITKEKEKITNDKDLRKKFSEIEKLLYKNASVREFRAYLDKNEPLLPKLANMEDFKEEVWKSYIKARIDLYNDLIGKYQAAEKRRKEIEGEATKQSTQWEKVIEIFNARFVVPFKLSAKNRTAVVLGYEPMISLGFTYDDGTDKVEIDKTALLKSLSTGEKKALYILNVIFDVEVRRQAKQETIMVIDDIADSFDYQNKYAIIQYLIDINDNRLFKQIIMTHNFDFFRTIESRLVTYPHCLMALKSSTGIALEKATGIRNVFVRDWKKHFFDDNKKKIASIPFIRNLVEYTEGETDPNFTKLTSLLHWKADSATITTADLDTIYNEVFKSNQQSANGVRPVVDLIHEEAVSCMTAGVGINFENKIVLALGIRLAAERFMVTKINDAAFVASIRSNQTQALLKKFRELFGEVPATGVLDRVTLMTPENIHLNSFMYEPIVDMSDDHLRQLYTDVLALK